MVSPDDSRLPELTPCSEPSVSVLLPPLPEIPGPLIRPAGLAIDDACVLLLAPAGSGKSRYLHQAMHDWIANVGSRPLWLPLLPGFTSARCLLKLLMVANGQTVEADIDLQDPAACLLNWLHQVGELARPLLICIDDIQMLDAADGWPLLKLLAEQRPPNLRLLLAGRYAPAPLGRWQLLPGWQFPGLADSWFSRDQVVEWLQAQSLTLPDQHIDHLWQVFHGWPAALTLWHGCYRAAGRDRDHSPAHVAELARSALTDYWQGEIEPISSPVRPLLSLLAVIPGLETAALAHILEAGADLHSQLEYCRQRGLIGGNGHGWRLMDGFCWVLKAMATNAEQQHWHHRAFQWFSQHGQPVEALQHARQANDPAALAPWVEAHAETILACLDFSGLVHWCELAGDELLCCSPRLMQIACWGWLLTWRVRKAETMLRQLQQQDLLRNHDLLALQGYLARLRGQSRTALQLSMRAWQNTPEKRSGLRFLLASNLTYLYLRETDLDNARLWNRNAQELARHHDLAALEALALFDQARIELHRGHLQTSLMLVDRGILHARSAGIEPGIAMGRLLLYRAFLLWISDHPARELEPLLNQGMDYCQRHQDVLVGYGYGMHALLAASAGRFSRGLDWLDSAERLLQGWGVDADAWRWLLLVKACVWISQGKLQRASEAIDEIQRGRLLSQLERPDIFPLLPDLVAVMRARLYLVSGRFDDCLTMVDEWLRCHSSPMVIGLVQLFRSAAIRGKGIADDGVMPAMEATKEAEGISMNVAAWLPELYDSGNTVHTSTQTARRVLLSEREHDVLRRIAEGLSNEEIAARLYISLHTVKTHARRINAKLGVRNRTQAIHRARELMLL